ncbi:hypothetical protein V1505DRAFT_291033, partial [Lipomyces doorenjongii]
TIETMLLKFGNTIGATLTTPVKGVARDAELVLEPNLYGTSTSSQHSVRETIFWNLDYS